MQMINDIETSRVQFQKLMVAIIMQKKGKQTQEISSIS